jgi:hypothetical protein
VANCVSGWIVRTRLLESGEAQEGREMLEDIEYSRMAVDRTTVKTSGERFAGLEPESAVDILRWKSLWRFNLPMDRRTQDKSSPYLSRCALRGTIVNSPLAS